MTLMAAFARKIMYMKADRVRSVWAHWQKVGGAKADLNLDDNEQSIPS